MITQLVQTAIVGFFEYSDVTRKLQRVCKLRQRPKRNVEISSELALTSLGASLCNVRGS